MLEDTREPDDWLVYLLVSAVEVRTYVGIARDAERRLSQHNGESPGGARSTRAGRPWELAATFGPYATRGLAQRAEAQLKRRRGLARLDWDGTAPAAVAAQAGSPPGKPTGQPRE